MNEETASAPAAPLPSPPPESPTIAAETPAVAAPVVPTEPVQYASPEPPRAIPPLPQWQSRERVSGGRIDRVEKISEELFNLHVDTPEGLVTVPVSRRWVERHVNNERSGTLVGGAYLRSSDGMYEGWMPGLQFQDSFTEIKPALPVNALRVVSHHQVPGATNELLIEVLDEPGAGGACHLYNVAGFNSGSNPSDPFVGRYGKPSDHSTILFQNGPIREAGANGVTHEALLAVVIDRLESFQAGPAACDENRGALQHLMRALDYLKARTRRRVATGTEGTSSGS